MTVSHIHEQRPPEGESSTADPGPDSARRPAAGPGADADKTSGAHSFAYVLGERTRRWLEQWSSKVARRNIILLAARGNIAETLRDVPEKMHKVARQTQLVIEFVDDFRSGRYRDMPWWAVAVAATALLYAVNPADAIPNALPIVGTLDDLAVVAVATRILEKQLVRYCKFKGYPVEQYF